MAGSLQNTHTHSHSHTCNTPLIGKTDRERRETQKIHRRTDEHRASDAQEQGAAWLAGTTETEFELVLELESELELRLKLKLKLEEEDTTDLYSALTRISRCRSRIQ